MTSVTVDVADAGTTVVVAVTARGGHRNDSTLTLQRAASAAGGMAPPGTAVTTTSTGSTRLRIVGSGATNVTVGLTDGDSVAWTWGGGSATGDLDVFYHFDHPGPTGDGTSADPLAIAISGNPDHAFTQASSGTYLRWSLRTNSEPDVQHKFCVRSSGGRPATAAIGGPP